MKTAMSGKSTVEEPLQRARQLVRAGRWETCGNASVSRALEPKVEDPGVAAVILAQEAGLRMPVNQSGTTSHRLCIKETTALFFYSFERCLH